MLSDFDLFILILTPFLVTGPTQLTKILIKRIKTRRVKFSDYFAWGGFPSSHSALVASLCTVVALLEGVLSTSFAIAFALAVVVMRDAVGLRMYVEQHAKAINIFRTHLPANKKNLVPKQNESIGHTAFEVWGGAFFGLTITWLVYFLLSVW